MRTLLIKTTSLFFFFSSGCFAVQTLQQCKDGLFAPSLLDRVCGNHIDHFYKTGHPAAGILVKGNHHLYQDKKTEDFMTSGLMGFHHRLTVTPRVNAKILLDINAFHQSLTSDTGERWDTLSELMGYETYPIPAIKPLMLLASVSFTDVIKPGTVFAFDGSHHFQEVQLQMMHPVVQSAINLPKRLLWKLSRPD